MTVEAECQYNKKRSDLAVTSLFCVDTWTRTKDPHHVKVIL